MSPWKVAGPQRMIATAKATSWPAVTTSSSMSKAAPPLKATWMLRSREGFLRLVSLNEAATSGHPSRRPRMTWFKFFDAVAATLAIGCLIGLAAGMLLSH